MNRLTRNILCFALGFALAATAVSAFAVDRIVQFNNAVARLTDQPCALGGEPDAKSPAKHGVVKFTDGNPDGIFCWVEEDGIIWILTDTMQVFQIDAKRAKPVGVSI